MPKFGGSGSVTLFSVQGDVERQLQLLCIDRIREKLGLEKVASKKVGNFDLPVVPSQEDYFMFPFRLLSKCTVGSGSYKATDFSTGDVLKNSVSKIAGKPAYLNHEQYAGREIGYMGESEWAEGYTFKGEKVPAGIDGPFVLDSKIQGTADMPSNADLIRKMSGPVPIIKACSLSVYFDWEASHDFEREHDFYYHLGEVIDGEEVRRVAKEIEDYGEGSLVYQGADPFARKKDANGKLVYAKMLEKDGSIVEIDEVSAFSKRKFGADGNASYDSGRRYYVFDSLDKEKFITLSKASAKFSKPEPTKNYPMNEELLLFIAAGLGMTADDIKAGKFDKAKSENFKIITSESFAKMKTEEDFTAVVAQKKISDDALIALKAEKTVVDNELVTLKSASTENEKFVKIGKDMLNAGKEEAKRLYGVFAKGKEEKIILDEIEAETDVIKLEAKIKMFGGQALTEFGGICADCGSKEINFRSSKPGEGGPGKGSKQDNNNTADALAHIASRD